MFDLLLDLLNQMKNFYNHLKTNQLKVVFLYLFYCCISCISTLFLLSFVYAETFPWRWVRIDTNLLVDEQVEKVLAVIRDAKRAGYNGIVLADPKFDNLKNQPSSYYYNVRRLITYAQSIGIEIIPSFINLGYPNSFLYNDQTLAEAMPVINQIVKVHNHQAIIADPVNLLKTCTKGLNSNISRKEFLTKTGWDSIENNVLGTYLFIDDTVIPFFGAMPSLRFENNPNVSMNRLIKNLVLKPYTQYRVSVYIKTQGVEPGLWSINTYIKSKGIFNNKDLNYAQFDIKNTSDWQRYEIVFNSQDQTNVQFYIGTWGKKEGTFWLNDIQVLECFGVNLVRREGCPIKVTNFEQTVEYQEGRDFNTWVFHELGKSRWPGTYHVSHQDIPLLIPQGSRIREGQLLKVSYYHVPVIGTGQIGICLTHPKTLLIIQQNIRAIKELFNPKKIFIELNELRVANQCGLCRQQNKTSGQLLADIIRKCTTMLYQIMPNIEIVTWADMWSPYHNAIENYYFCRGTLEDSWEGLDKKTIMVLWGTTAIEKEMRFFTNRGHRIIIAGYYDRKNIDTEIQKWYEAAKRLDNQRLTGIMYTTWQNDYTRLLEYLTITQKRFNELLCPGQ